MEALTVILKPIRDGSTLRNVRELARFTGLGAKWRAPHYLASHDVVREARDVR